MTSTKCSGCGSATEPGAKFCPECGIKLVGKKQVDKQKHSATRSVAGNQNRLKDIAIIVAVLAVVAIGFFGFKEPSVPPQPPLAGPEGHEGMSMEEMMAAIPNIPQDYEGLVAMGNQNMDEANFPLAAECYKRALAINADAEDIRVDFGACLHGMGLAERAIEEFMLVIADNPDHGVANFNLGIVYFGLGQNDSAKVYWQKYLAIEPVGQAADAARARLEELSG